MMFAKIPKNVPYISFKRKNIYSLAKIAGEPANTTLR